MSRFVTTIPLRVLPGPASILRVRFNAARSLYNAMLGECQRRLRLMRESRAWRDARRMAKGPARNAAFRECQKKFEYSAYALYRFIQSQRKYDPIGKHIDAHTAMAVAARAFAASERGLFKGDRPKFRRAGELHSVEGINCKSSLRWTGDGIMWGKDIRLPAILDANDPVIAHGLSCRIAYSRIVCRQIRGRDRYFAQLVCDGKPYVKPKHRIAPGVVGVTVTPDSVIVAADAHAGSIPLAGGVEDISRQIKRLQRQESRQRFLNNPDNFVPGTKTIKKGAKKWFVSEAQKRVRAERADLQRRQAEHRKNEHGKLAHHILSAGDDIRLARMDFKAIQGRIGRTVARHAPADAVLAIKMFAEKLGVRYTEIPKTKVKAYHRGRGLTARRDILFAFLARYWAGDKPDADCALEAWPGFCNILSAAFGLEQDDLRLLHAALPRKSGEPVVSRSNAS